MRSTLHLAVQMENMELLTFVLQCFNSEKRIKDKVAYLNLVDRWG